MTAKEQAQTPKTAVVFENYGDLAQLWTDICRDFEIEVTRVVTELSPTEIEALEQNKFDIAIVHEPGQEAIDAIKKLGLPITIIGLWDLDHLKDADHSVWLHSGYFGLAEALLTYLAKDAVNNATA